MRKIYTHLLSSIAFIAASTTTSLATETNQENTPFEIEITEITKTDATVSITPPDGTTYFWEILTKDSYEQNGGAEAIAYSDTGWFEYLAQANGLDTYLDILPLVLSDGKVNGKITELKGHALEWDTEYVLYVYGLGTDGQMLTEVQDITFNTQQRKTSDLAVDVHVDSIEVDELNTTDKKTYYTVKFTMNPSNDEEEYAVVCHEVRFYDQYENHPKYDWEDYLTMQFVPFVDKVYRGKARCSFNKIIDGADYYLVVTGWDEAPSTDIYLTKFNGSTYNSLDKPETPELKIKCCNGALTIEGEYDYATVYTADGKIARQLRGAAHTSLPKGVYIVAVNKAGTNSVHKVIIN
jgi:hypothetical protein